MFINLIYNGMFCRKTLGASIHVDAIQHCHSSALIWETTQHGCESSHGNGLPGSALHSPKSSLRNVTKSLRCPSALKISFYPNPNRHLWNKEAKSNPRRGQGSDLALTYWGMETGALGMSQLLCLAPGSCRRVLWVPCVTRSSSIALKQDDQ